MYKIKSLVSGVRVLARRIGSQIVGKPEASPLNDLPEEIIAKILEGIPKNEIPKFRTISRNFNSTIMAWFGTTLTLKGSRQDFPESLREGHITILKLKDCVSLNPQDLPPISRLRVLEIEGGMRLQSLVHILGASPNLRQVSIKFPTILDLDFDVTMASHELPARIETLEIFLKKNQPKIRVESSLLRIFSQLPLTSLKKFNCIYEEVLLSRAIKPSNDPSSLIKTILTKCRRTLRGLGLSRPYDWPEDPESIPIEEEFKLKELVLIWVGESRWLRSLIESQKTRSRLELLLISCYEDFWVRGVVQEVALASKATLKGLVVILHLEDDQNIRDELSLGFLSQLSKLEYFYIRSDRDFRNRDGRRVLEEPLPPLILPPTLKQVVLSAPITFPTLQAFCTLPALEELTLEGFKWVDWPTLLAIWDYLEEVPNGMPVNLRPSILLDWNWLMNLLKNCPRLKSIKFSECVLDFEGILYHLIQMAKSGALVDFGELEKSTYFSLDLDTPDMEQQTLFEYTFSIKIGPNRPVSFIDVCKSILKQLGHVLPPSKELRLVMGF